MNILKALGLSPDGPDEAPPDYETSVGGAPTNAITGASEITVNESSVVLDADGRGVALQQVQADGGTAPQPEGHILASSEHQPALSSDSDTSLMVGVSNVDLTEQECEGAKT